MHKKINMKEIKGAAPVNTWMITQWNNLTDDGENIVIVWMENQTSHYSSLIQSKAPLFSIPGRLREVRKL